MLFPQEPPYQDGDTKPVRIRSAEAERQDAALLGMLALIKVIEATMRALEVLLRKETNPALDDVRRRLGQMDACRSEIDGKLRRMRRVL